MSAETVTRPAPPVTRGRPRRGADEFEMLRNVTVGQYIPTNSIIHQLDPRAKITAVLCLILTLSWTRSLIAIALIAGLMLLMVRLSRIPISYTLRGILLTLPALIFLFALQFLFQGWVEPSGSVYFEFGWIRATRYSLWLIAGGLVRIAAFIILTSLITMTSTVTELTHGVESMLKPFRRIGVPSHEIALMSMIALRFVPTLAEEMERVVKAQASRCGDFGARRIWRPDKAAQAYLPLIVPLFIGALRRAEDLIMAMEARCYMGGDQRTKFIVLHSRPRDWVVALAFVALFVLIVFIIPWPPTHTFIPGL
jgi:energy-coupling factor transport system permease protein